MSDQYGFMRRAKFEEELAEEIRQKYLKHIEELALAAEKARQKQLQNKSSVAEFRSMCDYLYIDAMEYVIKIFLDPSTEDEDKLVALGEVIANLYNAIIQLDPVRGEKELSKYDCK